MEEDMQFSKVYNKPLTFFSRTRQEEVVLGLEQQFYNVITIYNRDSESRRQLRHQMEEIGKKIYRSITHYYFEDDLLDYLFSLASFIMNYMQEIEEKPEPSTGGFKLNQKFFNQEHPNFH
jgi:hypothetical protein